MRTAYCPKSHAELASVTVGTPYGHVPGHTYRDVDIVVSKKNDKFRAHICETWGSAQGFDEEHGRREVIGRGDSIRKSLDEALDRAREADITLDLLIQAVSLAEDEADE